MRDLTHSPDAASGRTRVGDVLVAARTRADGVASAARDTVRDRLSAWRVPVDTCCDAVLLFSELTTNAVLHTVSDHLLCGLTLTSDERRLRIECHDGGHAPLRLPEAHPASYEEGGRGLILVQELADRWGTARSSRDHGIGKAVRAESVPCS
ncbi:ATP-binding protein [Streptomyces sp. NPDC102406]|uniref:ATP-binding protein n=1 Tax=Streptomyces sp. NPDC102406 TaxID=3366171 RepID=UPI00381636A7